MFGFFIFIIVLFNSIFLCLLISILKTVDQNSDSLYDIERSIRILKRRGKNKCAKNI